jgi:hypothetical protein
VSVEEMAQKRVMRQFSFRQSVVPPTSTTPLPEHVHRLVYLLFINNHTYAQFVLSNTHFDFSYNMRGTSKSR